MCVSFHFSSLNLCTVLFLMLLPFMYGVSILLETLIIYVCSFLCTMCVFWTVLFCSIFDFGGKKARVAHSMCRKKSILFLNLHSVLGCHTIFGTVFIPFLTPDSHAGEICVSIPCEDMRGKKTITSICLTKCTVKRLVELKDRRRFRMECMRSGCAYNFC